MAAFLIDNFDCFCVSSLPCAPLSSVLGTACVGTGIICGGGGDSEDVLLVFLAAAAMVGSSFGRPWAGTSGETLLAAATSAGGSGALTTGDAEESAFL